MTSTSLKDFVKACQGTFLEEDRDSNFPKENTIGKDPYKDLCRELVETWDETIRKSTTYDSRRREFCLKVGLIVSDARARLAGC
jgi:hypothetical protein